MTNPQSKGYPYHTSPAAQGFAALNNFAIDTHMAPEQIVIYQIIVKGELDPSWSDWLSGFALATVVAEDGSCTTILSGPIPDQAALRGTLTRIWDLNLEVVALFRNHEATGVPPSNGV
jgi:hypothetical protein